MLTSTLADAMNLDWLIPLFAFPAFIAMWIGVTFLIGATGGWRTLAKSYASSGELAATCWRMQSGMMRGLGRYNHVLTVGADPRGLYLGVFAPFRAGHPPLFIPWEHIRMQERRGWLFAYVDFSFPAVPGVELTLSRKLAEQVALAGGRPLPVFA